MTLKIELEVEITGDFSNAYEVISDALIEGKDFVKIELNTVGKVLKDET